MILRNQNQQRITTVNCYANTEKHNYCKFMDVIYYVTLIPKKSRVH